MNEFSVHAKWSDNTPGMAGMVVRFSYDTMEEMIAQGEEIHSDRDLELVDWIFPIDGVMHRISRGKTERFIGGRYVEFPR